MISPHQIPWDDHFQGKGEKHFVRADGGGFQFLDFSSSDGQQLFSLMAEIFNVGFHLGDVVGDGGIRLKQFSLIFNVCQFSD
jgi:hypothetical protein